MDLYEQFGASDPQHFVPVLSSRSDLREIRFGVAVVQPAATKHPLSSVVRVPLSVCVYETAVGPVLSECYFDLDLSDIGNVPNWLFGANLP